MKSRINRDEREISISELWWYIISKWKWLVIGMVVGALLMGAFGAYKAYSDNNVEPQKEITMEYLTEEEQEEVRALIEDYEFYQAEVERLEKNYLMNLDYNTTYRCLVTYYVDTDYSYSYEEVKEDYASELVSMYKTYITSADVFQKILELNIDGLESYDLNYMLSTSAEGKIVKLAVYANESECEKIAAVVVDALEDYYLEASELVGKHSLTQISFDAKEVYGDNIKNGQTVRNTYVKGLSDSVAASKEQFNSEQTYVYDMEINELEDEGTESENTKWGNLINSKFVIVGAFGGIVIVAVIAIVIYMGGKKIKSVGELKQVYNVEMLGKVLRDDAPCKVALRKINKLGSISTEKEQKEYVIETIINKCKQSEISEIVICSTVDGMMEKLTDVVKSINDEGINCKTIGNINCDRAALNLAVVSGNVIFTEFLNVTTGDELEAEIETCDKLSINILGMIVMI